MGKMIGILILAIAIGFGAIKYFNVDVGGVLNKVQHTFFGMNDKSQRETDEPKDTCWQDGDGKKYYTTGDKPGYGKTYVPCEE